MERLNDKSVIDKAIARHKQHGLRVVYHSAEIYTSLTYTAAYLKFPDTKTFREIFAEDTNVYQNIVEPLISFIRNVDLGGGTVGLFGPTIAYIAAEGTTLLDVDLTCAADTPAITKPSGTTAATAIKTTAATAIKTAACVQLIHFGPQQCFDRPTRTTRNSAEFRGQFYAEDVNRAWVALKCLYIQFDKAAKSSRMSTKQHNQSTSGTSRYLTEADFTGSTSTGSASSVAQQMSLAQRSLREKANIRHTIAEAHLTTDKKANLAEELESSIESALINFKRFTAAKEPSEIRPTFIRNQLILLGHDMRHDITTIEHILRDEGKSVEQNPRPEAAEGSFHHLSALANTITSVGLAAGEDVTVAPEKYDQEEMDVVLQFQNDLCKSSMKLPSFEEAAKYLALDLPPIPKIPQPIIDGPLIGLRHAIHDYAFPVITPNLRLEPHQVIGVAAMRMVQMGPMKSLILADDMGLGKTIETLSTILMGYQYAEKTVLSPLTGKSTGLSLRSFKVP